MILEPERRPVHESSEPPHVEVAFPASGVELRGWFFPASSQRRGAVIYLHGRNENREAGLVAARRLVPLGYDVLAYDSRAHGASGGRYSTFGYYEKEDVSHAIDFLGAEQVVLVGVSLGAAVALQAAAEDPRIAAVVAVSSFSSLEAVVRDRVPGFVPERQIRAAFHAVEARAHMRVKDVDAVEAARRIGVPVLLLHGTRDRATPIAHARRVYRALRGPRVLVEVAGAHHADVLSFPPAWVAILRWLEDDGMSPHGVRAPQLTSMVTTSRWTAEPTLGSTSIRSGKEQLPRELTPNRRNVNIPDFASKRSAPAGR